VIATATAPPFFETMVWGFCGAIDPDTLPPPPPAIDALPWDKWLTKIAPSLTLFAEHHQRFWRHVWTIEPGERPRPFVAIWARGAAKSTSAELATIALGARGKRRYALYCSSTQEQADKHLDAIGALLESATIGQHYPAVANRAVNKYGSSRGWRRNRLTTASGFVVDAIGLATGTRGVRFEEQRPDLIIIDDVDELDDSPDATEKKIHTLTHTLLPAGSNDLAVIAIQNLVTSDGVFARFVPGARLPADFLLDRDVSGPMPAIDGMEVEQADGRFIITAGTATWDGQSKDIAQAQLNEWGYDAFMAEAQHQPRLRGDRLYDLAWWQPTAANPHGNRYDVTDNALLSQAVGRFMSWDTAESARAGAAFTACVVGDLIPYRNNHALLIRDVWRERIESPLIMSAIEGKGREWGFDLDSATMHRRVIVEYASSGKAVVQTAQSNAMALRATAPAWLSSMIVPFAPKVSKDQRAADAAQFCRAGCVWLPLPDASVPWLLMLEEELAAVPNSLYRDVTDAFAQLILSLVARLREMG
jgi:phage terminase large subunit-like protein